VQEGWYGEDYLILYDGPESTAASERYGVAQSLPHYRLVGLSGWDDFIVKDPSGALFTVPTVPLDTDFLESLPRSRCPSAQPASREMRGKTAASEVTDRL
jgi:hypothetical protein